MAQGRNAVQGSDDGVIAESRSESVSPPHTKKQSWSSTVVHSGLGQFAFSSWRDLWSF